MSNDDPFMGALDRYPKSATNPDNVGVLPDGMVMVQRSDAMRLAMFVEPLLTGGAVQLSAMRIAELCRAAPAGGRPYGGDPAEPRDDSDRYDSAPAGAAHVFVNAGDSEAQFIADGRDLNCPACGGSGHVDDSAPAGSGEVEALASRLVSMSNGLHSAHLCTDLRRAAALLRKLQQGETR